MYIFVCSVERREKPRRIKKSSHETSQQSGNEKLKLRQLGEL